MTQTTAPVSVEASERIAIIDADFHIQPRPSDPQIAEHLPARWRRYIETFGLGVSRPGGVTPTQREFTHRLDALDDNGRAGVDPAWGRVQVLDPFDVTAAVLTCQAYVLGGSGVNNPDELARALCRAYNEALVHTWMPADPRYYGSIVIPRDLPGAEEEIVRCKEGEAGERFVQVLMSPAGSHPIGNRRYWPIFETCAHYDIPVAFHVPAVGPQATACGNTNFYAETHSGFGALPYSMIPSLVFEGVFDRFPTLRVFLIELGWSWAVPLSWRLDAVWRKLSEGAPELERKPSEYLRDHFWFTTQPLEEPERSIDTERAWRMFEDAGFGERLMYSSDYPHWDFDSPDKGVPARFPLERRRRILGENASRFWGIPLKADSGIPVRAPVAV